MSATATQPDKVTIYAMAHPDKPALIRYIGATNDKLARRLTAHYVQSRHGDSPMNKWIRELISINITPVIWPLEIADKSDWQDRERYWIWLFKPMGILNKLPGGNGVTRYKKTQEHINKVRVANLGRKHTELAKSRMSNAVQRYYDRPGSKERNREMLRSMHDELVLASPFRKPILCVSTGEIFPSICEAERKCGYGRYALGAAVRRGKTHYGGKEWRYA